MSLFVICLFIHLYAIIIIIINSCFGCTFFVYSISRANSCLSSSVHHFRYSVRVCVCWVKIQKISIGVTERNNYSLLLSFHSCFYFTILVHKCSFDLNPIYWDLRINVYVQYKYEYELNVCESFVFIFLQQKLWLTIFLERKSEREREMASFETL